MPDRNPAGGMGGFLIGAALGAGVALLLAPASGQTTRRRLRRRFDSLRDHAQERLDEAAERTQESLREAGETVRDHARHVGDAVREGAAEFRRAKAAVAGERETRS